MLRGQSAAGKALTGYFVLNTSDIPLRINRLLCKQNSLLGPLPDFAVIEVGDNAVFWWHTDDSLDYCPREVHVSMRSIHEVCE